MQSRSFLRSHLARAWNKTLKCEYSQQLINSERGLQIYFCRHLLDEFSKAHVSQSRRLFIEPRLTRSSKPTVAKYPDIVICNTRSVIGIVEIKYLPRVRPKFDKDLETLDWVLAHSKELELSNDRYRGKGAQAKKYPLSNDAVLCWGGVYAAPKKESITLTKVPAAPINQRVFVLHAITHDEAEPDVIVPNPHVLDSDELG
jgi:hypothetical protein